MKTGVLYPFVDMLWVEEENGSSMSARQCTVSETHRKHVDVYQNLRNRLELASDTKLIVYMATIPRSVEKHFTNPLSSFLTEKRLSSGRAKKALEHMPPNLEFRVYLPHLSMKNKETTRDCLSDYKGAYLV